MDNTTLKIKKTELISAFKSADNEGKALLENLFGKRAFIPIASRIKNFEDVCIEAGEDPKYYELKPGSTDLQKGISAFAKLQLIFAVCNEGWVADWNDSNQVKYYPWFRACAGSGLSFCDYANARTYTDVGARLCTYSSNMAEFIGKTFIDIYNDFLTKTP